MPGVFRTSIDVAAAQAIRLESLGLGGVILFGIPDKKDATGSGAWSPDGIVQRGVRAIRGAAGTIPIVTDVCLCEYTDHGHCGLVEGERILNDPSVDLLVKTAISHAEAGADIVAPSDMMDGRIGAIRDGLDDAGYEEVALMSYAVKYASAFYGPFRDAAGSAPSFGDRRSHQMDPANGREAMREAMLDEEEGADILMVKPGMPALDIVARLRAETDLPIAVYQVSGEYAMLRSAIAAGALASPAAIDESLLAFRRAGADVIISYFAEEWAERYGP